MRLNTSPGMVCLSNEKPAFYFERDKKFFDPGGCMAENHSPARKKKQTSKKYGEYKEEPCSTQLSTKENHVNGRDNSESEGAVTANGSAILSKEKPKDVSSNEDSGELQVDEGLQAPSTNRKERSLSYHEVNTMNEFQYLSPGKDPLKPEEVSMLKIFYRFLTSSSSATDGNKNALKEIALPRATGASTGSEIRSKCVHSTSELSCCEALSMEIENLKERVTQNEDFRRGVVQEVRDQRKFVQSHQNDISLLRIEIATMQKDLVDLQIEHNRLNDEVKRLLVLEDPFRIRHDLTNLITSIEVTQFKMQRLENRSQSLETMVRRLTGKIEKLLVPYGPDVVQSTP